MNSTRCRLGAAFIVAMVLASWPSVVGTQDAGDVQMQVDRIFAKWTTSTPGCAVGVSAPGREPLTRAYGMADLEHDARNTPDTIFETGSVAKQFTAAAVLLLARDGKLSLDDLARKYIPELPDYGTPLAIRHLLTHTSGLRDWGSVAAIGGWPRTTRTYTHAHVLDIVSRQGALNFTPGTRYSYSNTGYNLAAILVSRLSGMSFAEFTRRRIFEPLGMAHSSWRDDYARIVKGRAVAYIDQPAGFRMQMPFENVHGNGGMLTTVGDLLKWNQNFASPTVGDAAFVAEQIQPGRFSDGRAHGYAFGLFVGTYKGAREISHGGATAAYRAQLSRFPDQRVSVAVLCNVSSATTTEYAHAVADIYLASSLKPPAGASPTYTLTNAEQETIAGLYRNALTGVPLRLIREDGGLRVDRGPVLVPLSASELVTVDGGAKWELSGRNGARLIDQSGSVIPFEKVVPAQPAASALQNYAGEYVSSEAETALTAVVEGRALVLKRRPDVTLKLTPIYADAFSHPGLGTVIFRRDASGRVNALSVVQDRVWDLRFSRESGPPARLSAR